ncbi:MAG TPA: 5-oxoprolinase/urea amidolyase family protein, partial [Arachnia sp.]|nr:5-oxoprolinase/urea amidolyase family protein [Arachnia sp.]
GPMDAVSLREANLAVGNAPGAPGLEITMSGPRLRFSAESVVSVTGADVAVAVDGAAVPQWQPVTVPAGGVLSIGAVTTGMRAYLAVRGGLDVPAYLGSASTFTLGGFGGHGGRALIAGDVLRPAPAGDGVATPTPAARRPILTHDWTIGVTEGPHAAPEFFTRADIDELYAAVYEVDVQSARTGVRLRGPKPTWAREDGGEAGLHPSNIHDTAYAIGALDFTGDTPIILGPDGPSLGGFVCPAVVASGELWKLGQLHPGDTVRFVPVREADATRFQATLVPGRGRGDGDDGVLARRDAVTEHGAELAPSTTYRRDGDANILVEYGPNVLDLGLRMRVHALEQAVA